MRRRDFVEDVLQRRAGNNASRALHAADEHLHRLVVEEHDALGMALCHHANKLIYLGHEKGCALEQSRRGAQTPSV